MRVRARNRTLDVPAGASRSPVRAGECRTRGSIPAALAPGQGTARSPALAAASRGSRERPRRDSRLARDCRPRCVAPPDRGARPPLDVVVRHDHVNGVFRSPLRHVAVHAGRSRTCTRDLRHSTLMRCLVAALAHRNLARNCFGAALNVVRVVARETRHFAALETCRLAQAVRAAGDLELVIASRCAGRVIEMNEVVAQRLPRRVRKRRLLVALDPKRQRTARRLEVALHACFELPVTIEFRRIHDGQDDGFLVAALDRLDMRLPRTMATLAVDALGKWCVAEPRAGAVIFDERTWVAVVTRHAPRIDDPPEVHVGGAVVARAHRPIAAAFGVPADRQLHEAAVRTAMQERARVIARPDDVVRLELEHIGFFSAKTDLMASLVELSVALNHRVVPVRRLVIHAVAGGELRAHPLWKTSGPCRCKAYVGAMSSWHVEQTAGSA